jgi:hypothetical protein
VNSKLSTRVGKKGATTIFLFISGNICRLQVETW